MSDVEPASVGESGRAWAGNATLAEIAERLRGASRVVVLTHSKPDGDAVGSTLALARTLDRLGVRALPVYLAPWPPKFDTIVGDTPVLHERRRWWEENDVADADLALVVDTGSWNQVADARHFLQDRLADTIIIDHHGHGDIDDETTRYIDVRAAAAAEPVADLCAMLLSVPSPRDLPADVAEPLYLGIATDTGWFRFANTTSRTLRLAADLIDAGVDADRIYQVTEQSDSPARLRLMKRAIAGLQLLDDDRVAIMALRQTDFDETGASDDEASGLVDLPKSIGTVRVIVLATEVEPALTKFSFRSKAGDGEVDVNLLAQRFGGGGHKYAAGAKIKAPLDEAVRQVTAALVGRG